MRFYDIKKSNFQMVSSTDGIKSDGMCYVFNGTREQANAILEQRQQFSTFTVVLGMLQAFSEADAMVRFAPAVMLMVKVGLPASQCSNVLFMPKVGQSADKNKAGQESEQSPDKSGTASAPSL